MLKQFIAVLFFIPLLASAGELSQTKPLPIDDCKGEAIYGFPTSKKQNTTTICRKAYVLQYDNQAKIPIWTSYVLTPIRATGCFPRTNSFEPDFSLPAEFRSTPKDYAKSGYDTGHMVNDGDMRWDIQAENESFILSNMTPQSKELNRGIWKKLEDSSRGWAIARKHPLQIYAGPIYDQQDLTVGRNMVTVPHGFFKVIIDTVTNEVMLYTFTQDGSKAKLDTFITSLAEVQHQTGLILPMPEKPIYTSTWDRVMKNATRTKVTVCSLLTAAQY
jgi:endonuclease G